MNSTCRVIELSRVDGVACESAVSKRVCLVESTTVAGTRHVLGVRSRAEALGRGDPLLLIRDAENPHDPSAVQVLDGRGGFLGYLSCEFNEIVSRLMDGGRSVSGVFRSAGQVGSWTKIDMAVMLDD